VQGDDDEIKDDVPASQRIGPTPERLAKAGADAEYFSPGKNENHRALRLNDTSPIDRLRRQMLITADQYNAGCRYFQDWYKAGFCPSGVIDPMKERVDGGTHKHVSDAVLAAQTRYNHALKALDYDCSIALQEVVLHERPFRAYANQESPEFPQFRERRAVALRLLRKGLSQLAAHYWPPRRGGAKVMVTEGARPGIMPVDAES